eukprot:m.13305 g.13305  ORF g.13305 m.13305 type:complete len:679 (-) comp9681_c0_seq2:284-2320(-)
MVRQVRMLFPAVLAAIITLNDAIDCDIMCPTLQQFDSSVCLQKLNNATFLQDNVFANSGTSFNSLGSYHQCKYLPGNTHLTGNNLCVMDILDPTETFTVITQGICLPSECNAGFIRDMLDQVLLCPNGTNILAQYLENTTCNHMDPNVVETVAAFLAQWHLDDKLQAIRKYASRDMHMVEFHCGDHVDTDWGPGAIVMLSLTGILILLCVISELVEQHEERMLNTTGYDTHSVNRADSVSSKRSLLSRSTMTSKNWPRWRWMLKAFCPSDTLNSLLERTQNRTLAGLDGLRSMSMMWIIFAHTQLLAYRLGADNQNSEDMMSEALPQQFTLGASLAIDTFFFLSGLLTTYTLLRRMRKGGKNKFQAPLFVALRYLRLTPLYAYILFFYAFVATHLGDGPVWFRLERESQLCKTHWWTNLLYINNFVPQEYDQTCMSWSWYLACDIQYFIVGLFILSVYLRSRAIGIILAVLLVITGTATGFLLLEHHHDSQDDYFDKPYTRVTPFAVGILLGIFGVDRDWFKIQMRWPLLTLLMSLSLGVIGAVVYVDYANFAPTKTPFTKTANAAYQAFGRLAFAIAISVLTFICVNKNKGIVNWFLSLTVWEPLGKLTYGAYLVHPIIIRSYYFQQVMLVHAVPFNQFVIFVAMVVISYTFAAILHVLVELPFASLTKLIITRPQH